MEFDESCLLAIEKIANASEACVGLLRLTLARSLRNFSDSVRFAFYSEGQRLNWM